MSRPFDIVTFDCYGTLVDWEAGIGDWFVESAAGDGVRLDRRAALESYARHEAAVEAEGYRTYRQVLAETASRAASGLGWEVSPERADSLADSLPSWRLFADTNPALERLSWSGLKLGILSNIDDDLLARTIRHFTVHFDLVVTAEQVGSYKPSHGHFEMARQRIDGDRWLHAAQSHFHDVVPARALEIPVAWVNRKGQPPYAEKPDIEVRDLTGLADRLERMSR